MLNTNCFNASFLSSRIVPILMHVLTLCILLFSTLEGSVSNTNHGSLRNAGQKGKTNCITSAFECDLSCLNWTFVLSPGRSGSTTVQAMISALPWVNFYGEQGKLLRKLGAVYKYLKLDAKVSNRLFLAWFR